jgi:hypothetical protein
MLRHNEPGGNGRGRLTRSVARSRDSYAAGIRGEQ